MSLLAEMFTETANFSGHWRLFVKSEFKILNHKHSLCKMYFKGLGLPHQGPALPQVTNVCNQS